MACRREGKANPYSSFCCSPGLPGKNVAVLKVALMMGKLLLIPFGEANTFFGHARLVLVKCDVCCWSGFKLDPSGH